MKKSLLAIGLSLTMVLAMATPAFAAVSTDPNKNGDGGVVENPGTPGVTQGTKESYNAATMTSKDGTAWETVNDDDALAGAADTKGADINVWAMVVDSGSKVYKVDLAWGAMKFEYKDSTGKWNTTSHTYDATADANKGWTETGFVDGTNNKVAITNHSNNAINAAFAYGMDNTKPFNAVNGVDNVIGNFFDANPAAVTASKVLTATYTDANGAVNDAAVTGELVTPVALPTADKYNSSTTTPTSIAGNVDAGPRTDDVYFAFSGTPDKGKGATLNTFKKVGVITVTVTPNNDLPLNQAFWVAP